MDNNFGCYDTSHISKINVVLLSNIRMKGPKLPSFE